MNDFGFRDVSKVPFWKRLYFWVLVGIAAGIALGHFAPDAGVAMKPLGDGFIKLIKMIIAPVLFCTIVTGIAGMRSMHSVGRVGVKALIYFEVMTTLALVIGLVTANVLKPGAGMNIEPASLDEGAVSAYAQKAVEQGGVADFLLHIVPTTFIDAFAKGDILQVVLVSILFAAGLLAVGAKGDGLFDLIKQFSDVLFKIIGFIVKLAPLGAFGAMAFTVGKYGVVSLGPLLNMMLVFYLTCFLFIAVCLGGVMRILGLRLWKLLRFLREELLIVLGTSIYLTMAALFIAQALNIDLSIGDQLLLLGVLFLTSKGAAGITGSGFVVLAATISTVGHLPVAGLALILGVDRFMSEARAITNFIGNAVATFAMAKWENALDIADARATLDNP